MSSIRLENVEKWFGDTQVIKGVDLAIEDGEFVVFVGPSGCGKSTLLRMIAGLEETSRGRVLLGSGEAERDVTASPPSERGLSMVFQSYALYPHMSVRENVGFGLKTAGVPKAERERKVAEAARILKLTDYLDRRPKALSGGQRQRVAIGRAIVREPVGFLFDEPLSNLDAALRVDMRFEIARLHKQLAATMIYVTHDQVEAMTLADRMVVLSAGRIMQVGSPRELYERPDNLFVAGFIGSPKMNVMAPPPSLPPLPEGTAQVGIRPEHIEVVAPGAGHIDGTVQVREYLGADTFLYIEPEGGGKTVIVRVAGAGDVDENERIGLRFNAADLHCFDADGSALTPSALRPALSGGGA